MILYQKLKITQSQLNHLYPQVTGSNLRSEIGYTHTHTHTHIYIYILKITLKKTIKYETRLNLNINIQAYQRLKLLEYYCPKMYSNT